MAMAQRLRLCVVATILVLALSAARASSTTPSSQSNIGMKSLHFTIYQHDTYNKTSFLTVNGVRGPGVTATTSPFGSLFVNRDSLTITPNPSSKVVGIAEGFSITSNFDGLSNLLVQKVTLRVMNHTGSLNVIGNGESIKASDISIVGGTGDFMFVQGYVRSTLVSAKGYALTYKADFHLYWPPYATQVSRDN